MSWSHTDLIDVSGNNRPNINARLAGVGDGPNLLLNGHSDVVDVPEEQMKKWSTDPWTPKEKDGKLFGRGASDMKGGNAAMLWGTKALMESQINLKGDVLLSLVIGEESNEQDLGSLPATKAFLDQDYNIPFGINAEPTGMEIHPKSAGSFDFQATIIGKEVHTSQKNLIQYPQSSGLPTGQKVGVNVVPILTDFLESLRSLEHQWNMELQDNVYGSGGFPGHDLQGVGPAAICSTKIDVGEFAGSIPGIAEIKGQIYYPPEEDPEKLWSEVQKVANSLATTHHWLEDNPIQLNHKENFNWPPYSVPPSHYGCQDIAATVEKVANE